MTAQIDRNTSMDLANSPRPQPPPTFASKSMDMRNGTNNNKANNNFHHNNNSHYASESMLDDKSMTTNGVNNTNGGGDVDRDVKVQVYYCGLIMVVYITPSIKLDELFQLLRTICKFDEGQLFTVKWVDEEGDPCTVSSQCELDEALRLYYVNKESELVMHVFANIPERPGILCAGEDRSIYRRGARRWRKLYLVNGHKYQAKRFARTALCKVSLNYYNT